MFPSLHVPQINSQKNSKATVIKRAILGYRNCQRRKNNANVRNYCCITPSSTHRRRREKLETTICWKLWIYLISINKYKTSFMPWRKVNTKFPIKFNEYKLEIKYKKKRQRVIANSYIKLWKMVPPSLSWAH